MALCLNEQQNNSFRVIDSNELFENFEKYIVIKFKELDLQDGNRRVISRNLKKEFDCQNVNVSNERNLLKTDPIIQKKSTSKNNHTFHNFFCLCFGCQTKKFIQRKRSNSNYNSMKGEVTKRTAQENKENKPKKSFILKRKQSKPSK